MTNPEKFIERFSETWSRVDPARFSDLFHPDGTLLHPGMEHPLPASAVPAYVTRIKSLLPDIRLDVKTWAARGDDILIEWIITASFRGQQVQWPGADRFTLRDDRAIEGVAYFDTLPLWARIDPSMKRTSMLESVDSAVVA